VRAAMEHPEVERQQHEDERQEAEVEGSNPRTGTARRFQS